VRTRQPHERLNVGAAAAPVEVVEVGSVAGTGQQFAVLYGS